MATKRILNKTAGTLIVTYNDGNKYLKLKRHSVTAPLPENHPVFQEASIGNLEYRGVISVLSDSDFRQQYNQLKTQLAQKEKTRKTIADREVEKAKAIKKAEEHNKKAEIQEQARKLMDQNIKGDATAETLLEDEKLEKVEVPKGEPVDTTSETKLELNQASVSNVTDEDYAPPKPKPKKRGRKPKKKAEEPKPDPEPITSDSADESEQTDSEATED